MQGGRTSDWLILIRPQKVTSSEKNIKFNGCTSFCIFCTKSVMNEFECDYSWEKLTLKLLFNF